MLTLTNQQSLRMAELPEDYRVVGVDRAAPVVRKSNGQLLRIQPNGRLVAATVAAKRRLTDPCVGTSLTVHRPLGSSHSSNH